MMMENGELVLSRIATAPSSPDDKVDARQQLTAVTYCATIGDNGLCSLLFRGIKMPNHRSIGPFASADELIAGLETRHICPGNHDIKFVRICTSRKSKFRNKHDTVIAFLDTHSAFLYKGKYVRQTVRSTSCSLLVNDADGRFKKRFSD